MTRREVVHSAIGALAGLLVANAAWSLVRVAEINAGKAAVKPTVDGAAVEQLLLAMTKETKAFESDLASKLGPVEAKRLAWSPDMCSDRTNVRAKEEDAPAPAGAQDQGGR